MAKPTTIKEAIKRWEEKHPGEDIGEALYVGFQFQWLPIEKMDNALGALVKCQKLSLSTNMIEKIAGLSSLKNLKVLSLGRNYIKNIAGLEGVADTLEELWISYNIIEKLKGIGVLKNLKVLYMSNNVVKEWEKRIDRITKYNKTLMVVPKFIQLFGTVEFNRLQDLTHLEDLLFCGNPLMENLDPDAYKEQVAKRLPGLKKLDGEPIFRDEGD